MDAASLPAGLYIHIPFCLQKCRYCDFYSVTDRHLEERFASALIHEIQMAEAKNLVFDSLYIGGGTPSVLQPKTIARIIEAIRTRFPLPPDAEITIEVNPGTVSRSHFEIYRDAGVTRINIGVQSFRDDVLRFLGRVHTARESRLAVEVARSAGFRNIGLDLIYGLPDQTESDWREEIAGALALEPSHLSCYLLTFEPGTPLDLSRVSGQIVPIADELAGELFLFTSRFLSDAGFEHYEISNFARGRAHRSRHNQKYWKHAPYLGFGPAAHSFSPPERKWNLKDVSGYIACIEQGDPPPFGSETLSREELMLEAVYLGLRQADGIGITSFNERFNARFNYLFGPLIAEMKEAGFLTLTDRSCALTRSGMLYADGIAARFADIMG